MQLDPKELHLGQADMDGDHAALAALLEKANLICPCSLGDCNCTKCPAERVHNCGAEMTAFAEQLLAVLIKHFSDEEALMDSLPKTREIDARCSKHRADHASFSAKYNKIALTLDTRDVVDSIGKLESFVVTWVREHILKFDAELASLIKLAAASKRI